MPTILEHKGERFIVRHIYPIDTISKDKLLTMRRKHGADIVIKNGESYFVLSYIEPANFEDINGDNTHEERVHFENDRSGSIQEENDNA